MKQYKILHYKDSWNNINDYLSIHLSKTCYVWNNISETFISESIRIPISNHVRIMHHGINTEIPSSVPDLVKEIDNHLYSVHETAFI